jgi:hypothetical protein
MSRRIIGQCNTADFKALEHLSTLMHRGEAVDLDNLSSRQKWAATVLRHLQLCGVPFEVALKLREVLIWEMPDKGLAFEYKLLNLGDSDTRCILQTLSPRKANTHG